MALGDLAAVKVHWHVGSPGTQTALGMQCISPFTNWRDLLAAEFRATIIPSWRACLSVDAQLRDITVTDVVPGTGIDVVNGGFPQPRGTLPSEACPANVSYVISWRSDGIGRNTRGRSYLFGLPMDAVSQTLYWDSAEQDAVQELVEVMLAQYGPTGFSDLARFVIISRGPHSAPLAVPQPFPVTNALWEGRIRSMRKRLRED